MSINYYPGFTTRFVETEKGIYINVSLKNKIESTNNILEYLQAMAYRNKKNRNEIKNKLEGRWFYFEKKKFKIDDILFDKNPKNQNIHVDGKSISLYDYYKKKYNLNIDDLKQPLILSFKKGPQGSKLNAYYIPELCTFSGLDESEQQDYYFMKELSKTTKIDPNTRIYQTNKILNLLVDPEKKGKDPNILSAKEKSELYGIEITAPKEPFKGYLMKENCWK